MNPNGGYKAQPAYLQTEIIHDFTVAFTLRYIERWSRTRDQMDQAARSGKQNIAEGYLQKSMESRLKLLGVARGSLEELLVDYQDYLRQHNLPIWDKDSPEARAVRQLVYHRYNSYNDYRSYMDSPEGAANAMICLINQTNQLLDQKYRWQEERFIREGGFRENLFAKRLAFRQTSQRAKSSLKSITIIIFINFITVIALAQPALAAGRHDPLTDGLVGWWKMDEASGNVSDSSGNNATGTDDSTLVEAGKYGHSRSFNVAGAAGNFPATSILDNFNRTNEGPPPTGWSTVYNGHKVSSNQLIGNTVLDANVSVWDTTYYPGNLEVYITLTNAGASPTLYILDPTLDHGYSVHYDSSLEQITIDRIDTFGSDDTTLGSAISQSIGANGKLGLYYDASSDTIYAYYNIGFGWTEAGNRTSSTYTDMTRLALFSYSTWPLDDFGGGEVSSGSNISATIIDPGYINSISAWFYPTTSAASRTLVTDSKLTTNASSQPVYGNCTGTALTLNQWTHIVAVSDGSSRCFLYQNGVLTASGNTGVSFGTSVNIGNKNYKGKIDETRIYNRALTPNEVEGLYNWAPGPVGYWNLDENTGSSAYDRSGGSNTLTLTNTPTWSIGKFGTGVLFAGSNQHLLRADDDDFDFADDADMTLATWFKHSTASAQEIILSKFNEAGYKMIMESDGDITCALDYDSTWTPTDSATSTAATYDDGNWHHLACVKSGAASLNLYIDGVLITTDYAITATNTLTNSDPLYIGINADGTSDDFTGSLDDVRIYNYARTPAQIVEDMNGGHPVGGSPIGSQVGYWKFDEAQGTTAQDSSTATNNNDLTLSAASWTTSGKFGSAWNGTGSVWLSRADDADFDFTTAEAVSFSGWFKHDTASAAQVILQKFESTGGDGGYRIQMESDGDISFGVDDENSSFPEDSVTSTLATYDDNAWHHFVAVRDGNTSMRLYLDGKEVGTPDTSISATNGMDNNDVLYVGDSNGSNGTDEFIGYLDELKIYRAALTAEQVKVEYNHGKAAVMGSTGTTSTGLVADNSQAREFCVPGDTSTCDPPIAWWKMDENTDDSCSGGSNDVCDSSGNGRDGAKTSMTIEDWVPGKQGSALDFDGSNDYINSTDFFYSDAFTICSWIRVRNFSQAIPSAGPKIIAAKWNSSGVTSGSPEWALNIYDHQPNLVSFQNDSTGTGVDIISNTSLSANTWYHLCGIQRGNGNDAAIYLDGRDDGLSSGTKSQTAAMQNTSSLIQVGARVANDNYMYWDGQLDDIRLYNYARTPAQIAWDYNKGAPIAWYRLDECSGVTAYNAAKTGNGDAAGMNGTITIGASGSNTSAGTCTSGTSTEAWYNGASGKRGASLDFDGTDDYVTVTNASAIDFDEGLKNAMSYAFWVYANSDGEGDTGQMFNKGTNTWCQTDTQGTTDLDLECKIDLGTTDANLNITDGLTTNTWAHVVVVYNDDADDELTIYINGLDRGSSSAGDGSPATSDTNNLYLGNNSAGSATFDGQIDDVRIYNYALTGAQIKTIYNEGAVHFGN